MVDREEGSRHDERGWLPCGSSRTLRCANRIHYSQDNIDLRDFYDIFGPIPDDEADSQISPHNSKLNTHEVISGYGPFDFGLPSVTTNPVDKQEFFSQLAYRPKPQAEQGGKTAAEETDGEMMEGVEGEEEDSTES